MVERHGVGRRQVARELKRSQAQKGGGDHGDGHLGAAVLSIVSIGLFTARFTPPEPDARAVNKAEGNMTPKKETARPIRRSRRQANPRNGTDRGVERQKLGVKTSA